MGGERAVGDRVCAEEEEAATLLETRFKWEEEEVPND